MNNKSPDHSTETFLPASSVEKIKFEWLTRSSRLSGMIMMVVNTDLIIKYYDNRIAQLLELNTDIDFSGRNMLEIVEKLAQRGDFGPGDPLVFVDLVKMELSKTASANNEKPRGLNFLTPSGKRIQFKVDAEFDDMYMLGCRDITESYVEKHALKVALQSSNSGYAIYDMEKREFENSETTTENAFRKTLMQTVLSKRMKDHVHPDDYRKLRKIWIKAHAKKEPWSGIFRTKGTSGETIWIKTRATPQVSESGVVTSYIFFYTEVTSQLRTQDDLRRAIERSEKSLSAKNTFLGRLSHEIRTPMNAVVGIADALIHHNDDPSIRPKLELIQSSAEKIIRIVDESLEHTKLAEAKIQLDPKAASPRKAVEAVCALWEQKALENDIHLTCKIDERIPESIIFDTHRYEQCLNNLLSNAVKFSPGGKVQVALTTIAKAGKSTLVTVVKDNGIGMTKSQLKNLFEAYTQADSSISGRFGGTGLGMNITKQMIELMGGKITAKSNPGSGTIVALTLPIREDRREEDRRRETGGLIDKMLDNAAPPASDYAKLKVLVVDDNSTNHLVVTSLLGTMVKEIDVAENGIEAIQALEKAEESNAQFDVVLMDIHMPIMDGIEATLAIRGSEGPFTNIPIIALTADPQYQQKRLCKNIGMDDALAKPIKLTEVLGAFDRVFVERNTSELAA